MLTSASVPPQKERSVCSDLGAESVVGEATESVLRRVAAPGPVGGHVRCTDFFLQPQFNITKQLDLFETWLVHVFIEDWKSQLVVKTG